MKLPPPRRRPKFAQWRYDRNLTIRATADMLEAFAGYRVCSYELVRTLCLPFGDPERSDPSAEVVAAIAGLTENEVTADDFRDPLEGPLSEAAA